MTTSTISLETALIVYITIYMVETGTTVPSLSDRVATDSPIHFPVAEDPLAKLPFQ